MARAKLFAAGAARTLGIAMGIALGPIGMVATALGFAAYQAGVFTSNAHAAADAARDLAAGIGTLAQAKAVEARITENNKEIAQQLYISEGTVKNHVTNLLSRLNLRDRTQAAILAKTYLSI